MSTLTQAQIGWLLFEIAQTSIAIARLNLLIQQERDDERDTEAFHVAVECLASKVGMLSDKALSSVGMKHMQTNEGDPFRWTMPPVFFDEDTSQPAGSQ